MTFVFSYCDNYTRLIPAVIIDNRANIPSIKNKTGSIIKIYVDKQLAAIGGNTIPYRIENEMGVLAGYFTVNVNRETTGGGLGQFVLRPAFQQFSSEISEQIGNFILNSEYVSDMLF